MEINTAVWISLAWVAVAMLTFFVAWHSGWGFSMCLWLAIGAPVSWLLVTLLYLSDARRTKPSPTGADAGGVPLAQGQTDDRQDKTPVNTTVNESVNKAPTYEYMTLCTTRNNIDYLRRLGSGGWKVVQSSYAESVDSLWLLLMREVR